VDSGRCLDLRTEQGPESIFLIRVGAGANINVCAGAKQTFKRPIKIYVRMLVVVKNMGNETCFFDQPEPRHIKQKCETGWEYPAEVSTDQDWIGLRKCLLFQCDYSGNIKNFSCDPISQVC